MEIVSIPYGATDEMSDHCLWKVFRLVSLIHKMRRECLLMFERNEQAHSKQQISLKNESIILISSNVSLQCGLLAIFVHGSSILMPSVLYKCRTMHKIMSSKCISVGVFNA